jgi:outer membrane protein assembly factor BamB
MSTVFMPKIKWMYKTYTEKINIIDGIIYFRGRDKCLYAMKTEDGKLNWKREWKEHRSVSGVAAESGVVYAVVDQVYTDRGSARSATDIGQLCALDSQTGRELWLFPENGGPVIFLGDELMYCLDSTPAVVDGVAYFSDLETVYAVDVQTRQLKWSFEGGIDLEAPRVAYGRVYVRARRAEGAKIYILDTQCGHLVQEPILLSGTGGDFVLADFFLFLTNRDLQVYDALTGKYKWTYTPFTHRRLSPSSSSLAVTDDLILFIGTEGEASAKPELVALRRSSLQLQWTFPLASNTWHTFSLTDGRIYLYQTPSPWSSENVLDAIDVNTGQLLWQFAPGKPLMNRLINPVVDHGVVFCTSPEGIYA